MPMLEKSSGTIVAEATPATMKDAKAGKVNLFNFGCFMLVLFSGPVLSLDLVSAIVAEFWMLIRRPSNKKSIVFNFF